LYGLLGRIATEDVARHRSLERHIENSKPKSLYCYLCQLAFMGEPGFHAHRHIDAIHRGNVRTSGQLFTSLRGRKDMKHFTGKKAASRCYP
jgi:hypothetical protein